MANKKVLTGIVALMFIVSVFISLISFPIQIVKASPGPDDWCVGSGCNTWNGNVSFDNTLEVQCTGKVELRQEVDGYVSYWRFDKGTGNVAYDENTTNTNDGSFTDGTTGNWTSSSKYGDYALDFDGTNDYVDCSNDVSLNITDKITIMMNIYIIEDSTTNRQIVGKAGRFDLRQCSSNALRFYIYHPVGPIDEVEVLAADWSKDTWYHLAGTFDKDLGSDNMKIYLNGEIKETKSETEVITDSLSSPLRFGYTTEDYFNGTIDEVKIYNRALSNNEINQTRDNEHHTSGNLTSWHDAGAGNVTYKLSINFTAFPSNTNASVDLYNNDSGVWIENLASHTTTADWNATITSSVQDSKVNVTLFGNVSQTPEIINITYHTQELGGSAPNITSWGNNYTNDASADFSCIWSSSINFNATANQTITTWNWYVNGTSQNHNFDSFTYYFDTALLKQIVVNTTNANGTSNSVQWNVTSNIAPEICEVIIIT